MIGVGSQGSGGGAGANRDDFHWVPRLIHLAGRGAGRVAPNPRVGAIIEKSGYIIAEGWHARFGGAHAEVAALRRAGARAKGATLRCSLEPCSQKGKTPPCTDAIIAAGIKRVIYYAADPNPRMHNRARRILARHGVRCEFRPDPLAESLIRGFATWVRTGWPRVELKAAVSLDGRLADYRGASRGLGDGRQRLNMMAQRASADAVLVGAGTILRDDPRLTIRAIGRRQPLIRVILDRRLETPPRARILTTLASGPVWIVTEPARLKSSAARALLKRGAELLPLADRGESFLARLLSDLGRRGVTQLLVEGGARVLGRFVRAQQYDYFWLYQMPLFLGEHGVPLVKLGRIPLARAIRGKFERGSFQLIALLPNP